MIRQVADKLAQQSNREELARRGISDKIENLSNEGLGASGLVPSEAPSSARAQVARHPHSCYAMADPSGSGFFSSSSSTMPVIASSSSSLRQRSSHQGNSPAEEYSDRYDTKD